jgi:3-methyl-2-oxobutanoate hydroxymethyltransferase
VNDMGKRKVTTDSLRTMKAEGRRIAALTAYDHLFAELIDQAGVDVVLVGDSVATVMQGEDTTLPVTVEQMLYHCGLVSKAVRRAFVVGDMPFLSYQVSVSETLHNAGRFMKEARAEAVKLEGGQPILPKVKALHAAGIPVMGHLGLTPQSIHQYGTYKVRGKQPAEAQQIVDDAIALEEHGAFAIVLEKIPAEVAARVTQAIGIPTIGIGAGPSCDGQILVTHDMLGMFSRFRPRFVRRYRELAHEVRVAVEEYCSDVREGGFPNKEESY